MYIETWHKIQCEKCNTENWLYDGDLTDISGEDIEGFKCRKCDNVKIFNEDILRDLYGDLSIEEMLEKYSVNIVDGKAMPR